VATWASAHGLDVEIVNNLPEARYLIADFAEAST
jgi:hypothetical protein